MVKQLKNSIVLLFAVWMIAASGGYSLFAHHCDCTGNEHVSLIFTENCNQQGRVDAGHEGNSCCTIPEDSACPVDDDHNCCNTDQVKFFKTSDYTAPLSGDIKPLVIQLSPNFDEALAIFAPEEAPDKFILPPRKLIESELKLLLHDTGAFHSALTCLA